MDLSDRHPPPPPPKAPQPASPAHAELPSPVLKALLMEAQRFHKAKNPREAALRLAQAEAIAKHHKLHHEAAKYRQALAILAQGGTPKLLARKIST